MASPIPTMTQMRLRAAAASGKVKDPQALAVATQVLIAAGVLVGAVLEAMPRGDAPVFRMMASATGPLDIATAVVFLCWFGRCRRNAEVFAPGRHTYAPERSITIWFVPVLMWWAPRRATLDIWRAGGGAGSAWVIDAWWTAWLACTAGVPACTVFRLLTDADRLWVDLVVWVAAALCIVVVRQVSAAQTDALRPHLAPAGP